MKVELHIDEIVLDGFGLGSERVSAAVNRELERILAQKGLPSLQVPRHDLRVDGGRTGNNSHNSAQTVGEHVARAVRGGLDK